MRGPAWLKLLAALLVTLVATAAHCRPALTGQQIAAGPEPTVLIYVAKRGWHIDVGFAAADLEPRLKTLAAESFPHAQYLFFGFGDRHYLLAKNRNPPSLIGALWPGSGLILATGLIATPQRAFGEKHVAVLKVTQRQARDAQAFIRASFDGAQPYARGPYEGSWYLAAAPRYSAIHTCNTWAAEALRAAALRVHSRGVVFAWQLWRQVRRVERKQSAPVRLPPPKAVAGNVDDDPVASAAGRARAILANDRGSRPWRHDHGGFFRWRGTAAADAAR